MSDQSKRNKPGPEPDRVKIDDEDWEQAVKKALGKKRPKDGWPDEQKGKGEGKDEKK